MECELLPLLRQVTPPGEMLGLVRILECVEIADQEIRLGQDRLPEKADEIWELFDVLFPCDKMRRLDKRVYRAHCRELIERTGRGEKLNAGTDAEILSAIVEFTLKTPATPAATLLYLTLFDRIVGLPPGEDWEKAKASLEVLYRRDADKLYSLIKKRKVR